MFLFSVCFRVFICLSRAKPVSLKSLIKSPGVVMVSGVVFERCVGFVLEL